MKSILIIILLLLSSTSFSQITKEKLNVYVLDASEPSPYAFKAWSGYPNPFSPSTPLGFFISNVSSGS